ncbi:MAG: rod shape-determining protein MreD, partial [Rhodobacteraceae bacterium]|nr:rod shape-determining protein MreD [Paracoccaceae bacterium]
MAETPLLRLWSARIGYLLVALVLMLIKLLPFSNGAAGFPAPDLLVLVTCVWVLRRPDAVPVLSVAGVFLLADIVF